MKKLTAVISLIFFTAAVSFAQNAGTADETQAQNIVQTQKESVQPKKMEKKQNVENIMGDVVKINTEKNEKGEITKAEVVIKTKNEEKTIQIDPKDVATLKEGMKIKVKIVNGEVREIKEIKKHETKKEMKKEMKREMKEEKKKMKSPQTNQNPQNVVPQSTKTN